MLKSIDELQKLGRDAVTAGMESFTAASKGAQAITVECADYARKSFEQTTSALEKLVGARTLDRAVEVQSDYAKAAYEAFVAQAARLGAIYADTAHASFKPIESYASKITPVA